MSNSEPNSANECQSRFTVGLERMAFEHWFEQLLKAKMVTENDRIVAANAWQVATVAEREACAKICDERKWRGEPLNFAEYCAEEIRMRSNVELRGATLHQRPA